MDDICLLSFQMQLVDSLDNWLHTLQLIVFAAFGVVD